MKEFVMVWLSINIFVGAVMLRYGRIKRGK